MCWLSEIEKPVSVVEFCNKHKRCRTCIYSRDYGDHYWNYIWECLARGKQYRGQLRETKVAGAFCPLYKYKGIGGIV